MTVFDSGQDDFFSRDTDTPAATPSTSDLPVDAVVLDLGGVVLANGPRLGVIARLLGRGTSSEELAEVEAAIWKFREPYDLGQRPAEYWGAVAAELGVAESVDLSAVEGAEADRWGHPLPDAVDLLDALTDSPVALATLCNAPRQLARVFDDEEWSEGFAASRFSGRTGILVPDPRMFELIERDLGVEPQRIVFFDNNEGHVEAARAHGWDARVWRGGDAAREELLELGVLR